jgi:hypothetical protein
VKEFGEVEKFLPKTVLGVQVELPLQYLKVAGVNEPDPLTLHRTVFW